MFYQETFCHTWGMSYGTVRKKKICCGARVTEQWEKRRFVAYVTVIDILLVPHHSWKKKNSTVKPVLSGHSKKRPKLGFQDRLSLNAGQKYCRMQYFPFSLSNHLSSRPLFCLFLEWPLKTGFTVNKCSIREPFATHGAWVTEQWEKRS